MRAQVIAALEIAEHGLGARRLKVAGLLGLPDHAATAVPVAREQPQQAQADLAMAANHQYLHGRQCNEPAAGGAGWLAAAGGRTVEPSTEEDF